MIQESPILALEHEIYSGIEEQGIRRYMNNFAFHLNFGLTWEDLQQGTDLQRLYGTNYRQICFQTGKLDTPIGDYAIPVSSNADPNWEHSPMYLSQTPREFYGVVDQVIAENGIEQDKLGHLNNKDNVEELYEQLLPVFIKLRAIGYSMQDLTA